MGDDRTIDVHIKRLRGRLKETNQVKIETFVDSGTGWRSNHEIPLYENRRTRLCRSTRVRTVALLISNIAYYSFWQDSYSQKVEEAVETAIDYYETHGDGKTESFYRMLQATGFQLYVQTEDGTERYGNPFRDETLSSQIVEQVKNGQPYYGMREYPFHLFLLGLFDNEVINTYGTSVKTAQGTDAIFVRPDLSRQIRELHLFVGLFLGLLVVISFLLLVFSIRYLVRPIRRLTKATEQMAYGDYGIRVGTKARDEIGELSRRFDEMATAVEASDTERRRSSQTFRMNFSHR